MLMLTLMATEYWRSMGNRSSIRSQPLLIENISLKLRIKSSALLVLPKAKQ
jgi:hypothetical protein